MERQCLIEYIYRSLFGTLTHHSSIYNDQHPKDKKNKSTRRQLRRRRLRRIRRRQSRWLHSGCGNHGREKQRRIRQPRIRLQRNLRAGLTWRDSWTYSSTLKMALFRANILTRLSGALTQVSASKVITVHTLACLSLLSTVYPILYRTYIGAIPPVAARNNFIKLIVLLSFNAK
jgi:hypothetical protein